MDEARDMGMFARLLLDPPARIVDPALRRSSRLVSGVLLLITPASAWIYLSDLAVPHTNIGAAMSLAVTLGAVAAFIVAYALCRLGFLRTASWITVIAAIAAVTTLNAEVAAGATPGFPDTSPAGLVMFVVPAALAFVLLELEGFMWTTAVCLVLPFAFPALGSRYSALDVLAGPFPVLFATLGLLAIANWHRSEVEEDRRETLEDSVRTHTQELEAARARLALMSEDRTRFVAAASHELRGPVNSIVSSTKVLLSGLPGSLNAEQHRQLVSVADESQHVLELIDGLLDLARIESGRERVRFDDTDVAAIMREVGTTMRVPAREKQLMLTVDADVPLRLRTDEDKVRRILAALTANAIKYTNSGFVRLSAERSGHDVVLTVSDTGPGITEDDLSAVTIGYFDRVHPDLTRQGTGLGLSLSAQLARMLGGELTVTSDIGAGSQVVVRLPG